MTPGRARIVRASPDGPVQATPLLALRAGSAQRRRISREEIEARLTAERLIQEAQSRAEHIVAQARDQARSEGASAAREAHEATEARMAARWVALRRAEAARLERDADRVIAVAAVLAERLLGAALELDPARVADLARTAIAEACGARRIALHAHPLDAAELVRQLGSAGLDARSIEVREDEALARGELRLHTDIGSIDAQLAPRLERLAAALRDVHA